MYLADRSQKSNIVSVLNEAASDIEDYGWFGGPSKYHDWDPYGTYPRCPWIAVLRVTERIKHQYPSENVSGVLYGAEDALVAVTHVIDVSEFFKLNDSMSEEEGKQWAINTLRNAADFVNGVPVADSETKETDTNSTMSQVCGRTTNVESLAKRFLNWLRKGV